MIGYPAEMAARAAAETLIAMHLVHTIRPWHRRFEQAFNRQLLLRSERKQGYYTKFIDGEFLRATAKDRSEYNKVGARWRRQSGMGDHQRRPWLGRHGRV